MDKEFDDRLKHLEDTLVAAVITIFHGQGKMIKQLARMNGGTEEEIQELMDKHIGSAAAIFYDTLKEVRELDE